MRVFVTGATGQLGQAVCSCLTTRRILYQGASSKELDITDAVAVDKALAAFSPDAVIHCAAYTRVDEAEENAEHAFSVNAGGARNVAQACRQLGAKMVYPSTDYVFSGTGDHFFYPFDRPSPLNVYGRSKLAGEEAVQSEMNHFFLVRTSWVFGESGCHFVRTMLRLADSHNILEVVDDQVGSPTYTMDLAPLLCDMIETERYGIYHATNEGVCSWAEFAREIFCLTGKNVEVLPVTTAQYGARAARPLNSRLDKMCLLKAGFSLLPTWHDALRRYLRGTGQLQERLP